MWWPNVVEKKLMGIFPRIGCANKCKTIFRSAQMEEKWFAYGMIELLAVSKFVHGGKKAEPNTTGAG